MNEDGVSSANPNLSLPKPPSSPPTPAASSAGASSPAFPPNGDVRRRHKSSADSREVVGSLLQGSSVPSCRPWERGDLLRRLSTFKLAGKLPKVAGSLACAKRGWVNVGVAKIECEICRAQLDFAVPSASSFEGESIILMDFFFWFCFLMMGDGIADSARFPTQRSAQNKTPHHQATH
ncbi:uncharacterized protein LOC124825089 [Vigna umbellata]|uniref:uncharacterized protein LOC124825089 n=1 Tax=Vigna umbellata TaxID=87088 RepID=UPI001F5E5EF8|nr:uncharacterized protein LOC124825089 [Vigna umbellata]